MLLTGLMLLLEEANRTRPYEFGTVRIVPSIHNFVRANVSLVWLRQAV